jgi:hypothetical protein
LTDEMEDGWEGCLSVPDMRGMVPRHTAVRLEAFDRHGGRLDLVAKEFFARVIQHETDHLHGIVYLDHARSFHPLPTLPSGSGTSSVRRSRRISTAGPGTGSAAAGAGSESPAGTVVAVVMISSWLASAKQRAWPECPWRSRGLPTR